MKLISCRSCGVVLDTDRIDEPDVYEEDGGVITGNSIWSGGDFLPVINCPNCDHKILYTNGDWS